VSTFSTKYDYLYNNKQFSDCSVKLEGTGETIPAHKNILASTSSVFEGLIDSGKLENNEILISKEVDAEIFKHMLKFLYTGSFNCAEEATTVQFMLLANKVKKHVTTSMELKISKILKYQQKYS
jgi:hypothetical protein